MAARSIASLTVSFGLVSIPVKLFSATEASKSISFNMLHKTCGSRLKQQYICIKEEVIVPRDEMVKGYEFAKDQYVQFSPEELKAMEEAGTQVADITEFVPISAVDLSERHELDDVDRARRFFLERLELVGGEDDVLVLRELVALARVLSTHDLVVVLGADVLLLEACPALLVEHVERHARLGLRGGVQVDRDGHEPERDGGGSYGTSGHERWRG